MEKSKKSKERELVKNTFIVAIGKICTQFVSFFLLPLYTALLSTEEYGIVDLLSTYVSLLLPLIFLQIDQAIFRYLIDARSDNEEKEKLISTTLITVFVQAILFIIFYIIVSGFINNKYKYFLATNVVFSMFSNILLQISRGLGDNETYSKGSLIAGSGTVILNVFLIYFLRLGAYGMLISTLIANMLCAIFVFLKKKIYRYLRMKNYKLERIKQLWKYSIPLVPNQLSWWIVNASDRTIVTLILGVSINGIYSAANKFSSICISIFGIFNMTWSESASLYINEKDSEKFFSNVINTAVKLFTSLCIGIIAFMPFLFKYLITGMEYKESYYQIPILMIATIFNIVVSLLGSFYVALKKSNEIAKTSIYSAIINILINLLLIRSIGLYAVSISTLISYLLMAIYRYKDIQKYVKVKIEKNFLICSIFIIPIIILVYYLKNIYLNILGIIIAVVFAFLSNKNIIFLIFSKLKKIIENINRKN